MAKTKNIKQQQETTKKAPVKAKKRAKKLKSDKGVAYVKSSFNNTLVTITDINGEVVSNSSAGIVGFKGSKKSTAYAATRAGEDAAEKALRFGLKEVSVVVVGIGLGRNAGVKGIRGGGLKISSIIDKTPIPHGGPTPRKSPRGS